MRKLHHLEASFREAQEEISSCASRIFFLRLPENRVAQPRRRPPVSRLNAVPADPLPMLLAVKTHKQNPQLHQEHSRGSNIINLQIPNHLIHLKGMWFAYPIRWSVFCYINIANIGLKNDSTKCFCRFFSTFLKNTCQIVGVPSVWMCLIDEVLLHSIRQDTTQTGLGLSNDRATASNSEKLSEVFWIHRRLKHSLLHRVLVFLSLNDPQGQLP